MEERPNPTRERILAAAEELLRRHGPAKTTVSRRGAGARHEPRQRLPAFRQQGRAARRRWPSAGCIPCRGRWRRSRRDGPAADRLLEWLLALTEAKRRKVHDDPELFANYHAIAEQARGRRRRHVATLRRQVAAIVARRRRAGEFAPTDPEAPRRPCSMRRCGSTTRNTCARRRAWARRICSAAGRPARSLLARVIAAPAGATAAAMHTATAISERDHPAL